MVDGVPPRIERSNACGWPGFPGGHLMRLGSSWRFAGHQRGVASIAAIVIGALLTVGASTVYVVVSPQVADSARTDSTSQAGSPRVSADPAATRSPPTPTPPKPSLADLAAQIVMVTPATAYSRQLTRDVEQSFDTEREIVVRYLNGDIQRFDAVGPIRETESAGLLQLQWRDADDAPAQLFISPSGVASVEIRYKETTRKLTP